MHKHIIYLAAGNSRRFGVNKLLYLYEGKPLFRHGLDMLEAVCRELKDTQLTVVTRYPEIADWAARRGIRVQWSENSIRGAAESIRAGILSLTGWSEQDYVLFVVADQPQLTGETVKRLLGLADGKTETAAASCRGHRGNPVLFSMKFREELLALAGDEGGRRVLKRHACIPVEVADARELQDIDTKEDLRAAENSPADREMGRDEPAS